MKVLICIPCLLTGGTEIQTLSIVRALIQGGHQVTTVCYFEFSELMINNFKNAGSEVICLQNDGLRIGGKSVIPFLYKGLSSVVKQFRPNVVHVQYMAPGAIPILILKLLGAKNIVTTAHTAADIYPNLALIHFIQKRLVRAFTCITLRAENSFFGISYLYKKNTILKKRNHFTIYNTLPQYIQIRNTEKMFDNNILTIGVVSRLERIKGMDLVVPAFAEVIKQGFNVKLLVVGDGSLKNEMEKQSIEFSVSDFIEWKGRTEQSKLQEYYDKIDILLMPSRSEGFGLTAIEGMARGCVPVVSDTGGLPEVVQDNISGLLHKTEDIHDLADKIVSLCENRKKLESFSKNAVERAKMFEFDKYSILINDLYSKLIK